MKLTKYSLVAILVLGGLAAFTPVTHAAKTGKKSETTAATPAKPKDRLASLTEKLSLTPDQQDKVKGILKEESAKLKGLRAKGDLTQTQRKEQAKAIQQDTNTKIRGLLTPDQAAKWPQPKSSTGPKASKGGGNKNKTKKNV